MIYETKMWVPGGFYSIKDSEILHIPVASKECVNGSRQVGLLPLNKVRLYDDPFPGAKWKNMKQQLRDVVDPGVSPEVMEKLLPHLVLDRNTMMNSILQCTMDDFIPLNGDPNHYSKRDLLEVGLPYQKIVLLKKQAGQSVEQPVLQLQDAHRKLIYHPFDLYKLRDMESKLQRLRQMQNGEKMVFEDWHLLVMNCCEETADLIHEKMHRMRESMKCRVTITDVIIQESLRS